MRALLIALLLLPGVAGHESQTVPEETSTYVLDGGYPLPADPTARFADFLHREEMATAGNLTGAERIWRIIQVTDMQLVDDDAPEPIRVGSSDPIFTGANVSDGAQRPHEEYSDEILHSMIDVINAHHAMDKFQFAIHTGDNIDNALENELMRYLDLVNGGHSTVGPFSGYACLPDGQSMDVEDPGNDVTETCTSLPSDLVPVQGLASDLPWYSMYGNHDGLIQGNVNIAPSFQDLAAQYGRYFLPQSEYIDMHFANLDRCSGGNETDDFGHGYGFAGSRLCDNNVDNDGYYAFDVGNVHFIVLDTVNDEIYQTNQHTAEFPSQSESGYDVMSGVSEGSLDVAQFQWLQTELEQHKNQLTMIFAHHTINAFYNKHFDPACGPPCLSDALGEAGFIGRDEVHDVLREYPNMVAFIGGHTHQHRVQAAQFEDDAAPVYWNIETSGLLDTPQETRIMELWQSEDKLFLALDPIGHTFALARDLAYGDTTRNHAEKEGTPLDQRVLLWLDRPDVDALEVSSATNTTLLTMSLLAPMVDGKPGSHTLGNQSLQVLIEDGQPVPGLYVTAQILVAAGDGALTVQEKMPMQDLGDGRYELTADLYAPGEFAYRIDATDPTGAHAAQYWEVNFLVEQHEVHKDASALGLLALLVCIGIAVVRRW